MTDRGTDMRLLLCEKPSQSKDIARVIGATQRANGYFCNSSTTVTWCIGHLLEAAPPESYATPYKRWSLEQLPIIPETWKVVVKVKTATPFEIIKQLLSKTTLLIIATDADREGEMIARELIGLCQYKGPIQRLWLSALDDASIRKSLESLNTTNVPMIEPAHVVVLPKGRPSG